MLIVDDHAAVRSGVRELVATEPALRVVGEAASAEEALGVALVLRPDLVVLDHEMPGQSGLEILPKLRVILPDVRIVMFTMTTGIARQARLAGAEQVIAKDDLNGLLAALRGAAADRATQRRPAAAERHGSTDLARLAPRLLAPALALVYALAFDRLVDAYGPQIADVAILIVAAAGATYGLRGGLIAAALALPLNIALFQLAGITSPAVSVPRAAIAVAIGASFGLLRDVGLRARAQAQLLAETSAALEASDRRSHVLVEAARVLVAAIDTSGLIVDALGGGFGDDHTLAAERMRGQQAAVYFADDPNMLAQLGRAVAGEEFSAHVTAYGHVYDVHFRPRTDETGAFAGTTAVLVNVEPSRKATRLL